MSDLQETLRWLYESEGNHNSCQKCALECLTLVQNTIPLEFIDPRTGLFLPVPLSLFLKNLKEQFPIKTKCNHDRVFRIISFLQKSLIEIISAPRNKITREHVIMPQYQARNFDQQSIQWLIRRPGKTLNEKLSSSPRIMAVKRQFVIDTSENRLLKEFINRLYKLLQIREEYFGNMLSSEEIRLKTLLTSWLNKEATDIRQWNNVPPNNILLNDKYYKKVWNQWGKLRHLEKLIHCDVTNAPIYALQLFQFVLMSRLGDFGVLWAEFPFKINITDDENQSGFFIEGLWGKCIGLYRTKQIVYTLIINTNNNKLFIEVGDTIITCISKGNNEIEINGTGYLYSNAQFDEPVNKVIKILKEMKILGLLPYARKTRKLKNESISIDLSSPSLLYCKDKNVINPNLFLARQYWNKLQTSISLVNVPAWQINDESSTFSITDLLWNNVSSCNNLAVLAQELASDAKQYIQATDITFVIPDAADDFNDNIQNCKYAFDNTFSKSNISWLPSSIATVFSLRDFWKGTDNRKKSFCVVERFGNILVLTNVLQKKLEYSDELNSVFPDTRGYVWERQEPLIITSSGMNQHCDNEKIYATICPIWTGSDWIFPEDKKQSPLNLYQNDLLNYCRISNEYQTIIVLISPNINICHANNTRLPYIINFANFCMSSSNRLVAFGAELLKDMQKQFSDHPLWTDNLPQLTVVFKDAASIDLISEDHAPISTNKRGEMLLTTSERILELPAETNEPTFEIFRKTPSELKHFLAQVKLPYTPKEKVQSRISLWYTYGSDKPFRLEIQLLGAQGHNNEKYNANWLPRKLSANTNIDVPYKPNYPWNRLVEKKERIIGKYNLDWWNNFISLTISSGEYIHEHLESIEWCYSVFKGQFIKCIYLGEQKMFLFRDISNAKELIVDLIRPIFCTIDSVYDIAIKPDDNNEDSHINKGIILNNNSPYLSKPSLFRLCFIKGHLYQLPQKLFGNEENFIAYQKYQFAIMEPDNKTVLGLLESVEDNTNQLNDLIQQKITIFYNDLRRLYSYGRLTAINAPKTIKDYYTDNMESLMRLLRENISNTTASLPLLSWLSGFGKFMYKMKFNDILTNYIYQSQIPTVLFLEKGEVPWQCNALNAIMYLWRKNRISDDLIIVTARILYAQNDLLFKITKNDLQTILNFCISVFERMIKPETLSNANMLVKLSYCYELIFSLLWERQNPIEEIKSILCSGSKTCEHLTYLMVQLKKKGYDLPMERHKNFFYASFLYNFLSGNIDANSIELQEDEEDEEEY